MNRNKRSFVLILVLALPLCFVLTACNIAGFIVGGNNTIEDDSTEFDFEVNKPDTSSTPAGTQNSDPNETIVDGNEEKTDYRKVYDALLSDWKSALGNYRTSVYTGNDMLDFYFYDNSSPELAKGYYSLFDIDCNGIIELILKKQNDYEDIVAYIFTMKDDEPINVFGYDGHGIPVEVPWSRVGSSSILSNGLIDSMDGDWSIYKIADDGYSVTTIASQEPADYNEEANPDPTMWKYYTNGELVEYSEYVRFLDTQGYILGGANDLAVLEWESIE